MRARRLFSGLGGVLLPGVAAVAVAGLWTAGMAAQGAPGTVRGISKISHTRGGNVAPLHDNDQLGRSVAVLGDLDGNGVLDLASSGQGDDDGGIDQGAAYVFFLRPDGRVLRTQKISELVGGFGGVLDPGDQFGRALAGIGDLDGDGVPDLAVGANYDDDGGSNRGAVWLLRLRADGTVRSTSKISSTQGEFAGPLRNNDEFGRSVVAIGDLDGDGREELAVGAPTDSTGGTKRGAVYVLFLEEDGGVERHVKIASGLGGFTGRLRNTDWFGFSLARLGDFDGDGVPDLAVGAALDDDGAVNAGAAWLLFLRPDGTVKGHRKISLLFGGFTGVLESPDQFGTSVARVGDLNGDGVPELAVGAVKDDDGGTDRGAVYVLFPTPDGSVAFHQKISHLEGGFPPRELGNFDWFGSALAPLGDFNGDGVPDLAIGARNDDDGGPNRGAFYLTLLHGVPSSALLAATGPRAVAEGAWTEGPDVLVDLRPEPAPLVEAQAALAASHALAAGPEPVGDLELVEGDGAPGSALTFRMIAPPELASRGGLARLLVAAERREEPARAERTGLLLAPAAVLGVLEAVAAPGQAEVELTLRLPSPARTERLVLQGLWLEDGAPADGRARTRWTTDALEVELER